MRLWLSTGDNSYRLKVIEIVGDVLHFESYRTREKFLLSCYVF